MNSKGGFDNLYIPVPETGCWLWFGAWNVQGYGRMTMGNQTFQAHRYSWIKHFGPIPDGMHVCHKCDTPACVNPAHLFIGTSQQNMRDMSLKGRQANRKLTEAQAKYILESPAGITTLAMQFRVTKAAITHIRKRRNWKHVSELLDA